MTNDQRYLIDEFDTGDLIQELFRRHEFGVVALVSHDDIEPSYIRVHGAGPVVTVAGLCEFAKHRAMTGLSVVGFEEDEDEEDDHDDPFA